MIMAETKKRQIKKKVKRIGHKKKGTVAKVMTNEQLIEKALKLIKEQHLYFIEDIATELGIGRSTFYDKQLDKVDVIREALLVEKTAVKRGLRNKWYNSDNATVQIALYRLTASKEELDALSQSKQLVGGVNGEPIQLTLGASDYDDDSD